MTHQHNCWCGNRVKRRERWLGSSPWPSHGIVAKSWHRDDTPHWGRSSSSHGIFYHIIIALFNAVSCLWNCAMTLCTESGYVIPVSNWCGTLGNCAMTLPIEIGLSSCIIFFLNSACVYAVAITPILVYLYTISFPNRNELVPADVLCPFPSWNKSECAVAYH